MIRAVTVFHASSFSVVKKLPALEKATTASPDKLFAKRTRALSHGPVLFIRMA